MKLLVASLIVVFSIPSWSSVRECFERFEENGKRIDRQTYFNSEYPWFEITQRITLPDGNRDIEDNLLLSPEQACGVVRRDMRCRSKTLEIFGRLTYELECDNKIKLKIEFDRRGEGSFACHVNDGQDSGTINMRFSRCWD